MMDPVIAEERREEESIKEGWENYFSPEQFPEVRAPDPPQHATADQKG